MTGGHTRAPVPPFAIEDATGTVGAVTLWSVHGTEATVLLVVISWF